MNDYTSAEFWKGAPDTSTHYQPPRGEGFNPVFWRVDNGVPVEAWAVMQNGSFTHVPKPSYIDDVFGRLIPRPAPQWSGEGLPPIGAVCEMHIDGGEWVFGTVAVHIDLDRPVAVAHNGEDVFHGYAGDFRPIKTPAQIAAEEREAAIEAMWNIYWQPDAPTAKQALGLLWDAGLRFPKGGDQ